MVVKVYISGISGNKEVKKRQQRVLMILDSKTIKYSVVDITEPGQEAEKDFMQNNSTSKGATIGDVNPRHPLPPQIFNESEYCGDYDQFDTANEIDTLEQFLKLEPGEITQTTEDSSKVNVVENHENVATNGETKTEESMETEALPQESLDLSESAVSKEDDHPDVEKEEEQNIASEELVNAEEDEISEEEEEEKSD